MATIGPEGPWTPPPVGERACLLPPPPSRALLSCPATVATCVMALTLRLTLLQCVFGCCCCCFSCGCCCRFGCRVHATLPLAGAAGDVVVCAPALHVVFMPRCERWLYENFLASHAARADGSAPPPLRRVVLIGNTFRVFEHQSPHDALLEPTKRPPPPPPPPGELTEEEEEEEEEEEGGADGGTTAPVPEPERPYWQGHRETPLHVAPGAPYWTALSGLVAHEWDV
jgi:hypothetical protein